MRLGVLGVRSPSSDGRTNCRQGVANRPLPVLQLSPWWNSSPKSSSPSIPSSFPPHSSLPRLSRVPKRQSMGVSLPRRPPRSCPRSGQIANHQTQQLASKIAASQGAGGQAPYPGGPPGGPPSSLQAGPRPGGPVSRPVHSNPSEFGGRKEFLLSLSDDE